MTRCELRKHLRYGRGKKITPEKADELVKSGKLLSYAVIGGFETYTWEVPA
ncbi:MAG: hypothetical protein H5T34_04220 [Candidatus Methanomethyliales bacterium]|nr:hypothetical protein [Candidatus Methanomethylicales archaeon]